MSTSNTQGEAKGIVIVTHGNFGESLLEAAELILGPQPKRAFVGIDVSDGVDKTVDAIRNAIKSTGGDNGALILTDLFGGTPTTLSLSLFRNHSLEVITGVNLPMIVKAFQKRDLPMEDLAREVRDAAIQGIVVAGQVLRRKNK